MTESVTPRAPDPPLVDPETGETAPLSPQRKLSVTQAYERARVITRDQFLDAATLGSVPEATRRAWLYGEWDDYERDIAAHVEPDDAA
jgi:hypothetical protein